MFVLDGDIHKAYDYTKHRQVIRGLQQKKTVPNILIAAWLREIRRVSSTFVLDSSSRSDPIKRTRSLCQGDPAAPTIFNCALDDIAAEFCQSADTHNWGIKLQCGARLSLMLFADNFWIFATSPQELTKMSKLWLRLLHRAGWQAPVDEMTWCTTGPDTNLSWQIHIDGFGSSYHLKQQLCNLIEETHSHILACF